MKKINKVIIMAMSLLLPFLAKAQEVISEPQMADTFRSEGKIYVVITVISIIFVCLIGYLIYIDMKLRKLEKKDN
jgi:uncharacterized membrane protein YdbT with pleckstrin-like domain